MAQSPIIPLVLSILSLALFRYNGSRVTAEYMIFSFRYSEVRLHRDAERDGSALAAMFAIWRLGASGPRKNACINCQLMRRYFETSVDLEM